MFQIIKKMLYETKIDQNKYKIMISYTGDPFNYATLLVLVRL